jgi:hypothetical protein
LLSEALMLEDSNSLGCSSHLGAAGNALRALDWGELSARLGAARDLRFVLRQERGHTIEDSAASFSDAAAQYFRSLGDCERHVNLDDLEASKALHVNVATNDGKQAVAARDDTRDAQ